MNEVLTLLGIIAGGLTALGIVWKMALVPIYRLIRKIETAHDLILEFPIWQADVNRSLSQLHPNGGYSIKDVVNTTKVEMSQLKELVETHITDFDAHLLDPDAHPARNPDEAS